MLETPGVAARTGQAGRRRDVDTRELAVGHSPRNDRTGVYHKVSMPAPIQALGVRYKTGSSSWMFKVVTAHGGFQEEETGRRQS